MIADLAVFVVAVLHIGFLVLEMFLWEKPLGLKVFGMTAEAAQTSKILAANQGLYNGFLAVGLAYSVILGEAGDPMRYFFLGCVVVAGLYGAATATRATLVVQTLPAAIAIALTLAT